MAFVLHRSPARDVGCLIAADRRAVMALASLFAMYWVVFAPVAGAQAYPVRPITMAVPFTPGCGTDIMAMVFSDNLGRGLGVQVLVNNRSGAGGTRWR